MKLFVLTPIKAVVYTLFFKVSTGLKYKTIIICRKITQSLENIHKSLLAEDQTNVQLGMRNQIIKRFLIS